MNRKISMGKQSQLKYSQIHAKKKQIKFGVLMMFFEQSNSVWFGFILISFNLKKSPFKILLL